MGHPDMGGFIFSSHVIAFVLATAFSGDTRWEKRLWDVMLVGGCGHLKEPADPHWPYFSRGDCELHQK